MEGAASGVAMVSIDGEHVVTDNSTDEASGEDEDSDSEAIHENTNKTFKPFRDTKDKSTVRGIYSCLFGHHMPAPCRYMSLVYEVVPLLRMSRVGTSRWLFKLAVEGEEFKGGYLRSGVF